MIQESTADTLKKTAPDTQNEMNTISTCMVKSVQNGYTENFTIKEEKLYAPKEDTYYTPDQVKINNFYRFEGQSDPGDESVLYEIETNTGIKGILINAYGHYGDKDAEVFIQQVEDITKKTVKS